MLLAGVYIRSMMEPSCTHGKRKYFHINKKHNGAVAG